MCPLEKAQGSLDFAENFYGSSVFFDEAVPKHQILLVFGFAAFLENLVDIHRDRHLNFHRLGPCSWIIGGVGAPSCASDRSGCKLHLGADHCISTNG